MYVMLWNALESILNLRTSLKDAEVKSRTEHYPAGISFQENITQVWLIIIMLSMIPQI